MLLWLGECMKEDMPMQLHAVQDGMDAILNNCKFADPPNDVILYGFA